MANITKQQLDQTRELLLPLLPTRESREALVGAALWGNSVLHRITWEGAASIFVIHLAKVLDNAELASVLTEARTQVGEPAHTQLSRLAAEIESQPKPPLISDNDFSNDTPPTPIQLRDLLQEKFSVKELETLCFDLGVSADEIDGHNSTKPAFAREIVEHFRRRGKLHALTNYISNFGKTP